MRVLGAVLGERSLFSFVALLGALLVIGPVAVEGQTTLGLRGGVSLATAGGDDVTDVDSRTGVTVSGAVTFGLASNVGLQLGAGYVQKGVTDTEDGVDVTFALDYIEVPLLLRLGVPTAGVIAPHFYVGPAVSFEASCEAEGTSGGVTATVQCDDFDVETKAIDVGAMAGAGLDIATSGPLSVTLDVFYNFGLTSIDDSVAQEDIKNRVWLIVAGVGLEVG